jgi:hypothetical protein
MGVTWVGHIVAQADYRAGKTGLGAWWQVRCNHGRDCHDRRCLVQLMHNGTLMGLAQHHISPSSSPTVPSPPTPELLVDMPERSAYTQSHPPAFTSKEPPCPTSNQTPPTFDVVAASQDVPAVAHQCAAMSCPGCGAAAHHLRLGPGACAEVQHPQVVVAVGHRAT